MEVTEILLTRVFAGRVKSKYIKGLAILPERCWEMTLLFKDVLVQEYLNMQRKKKH